MIARTSKSILLILLSGSCIACGYQLQGSAELPAVMSATYIQASDPYTEFVRGLKQTLKGNDIELTANPTDATAVLVIHQDISGERILTVSADNIPLEYEVFYTVSYELIVGGESMLPSETLTRRRNYTYSKTDVLGKREEGRILREAIADDLVRTITRRLATVDTRLSPAGAGAPGS